MIRWIFRLLGANDEVSTNRTVAFIAFLTLLIVIILGLTNRELFNNDILKQGMTYLYNIVILALGFKGGEKAISYVSDVFKKNKEVAKEVDETTE